MTEEHQYLSEFLQTEYFERKEIADKVKMTVFWLVAPRSLVRVYLRFRVSGPSTVRGMTHILERTHG
jgi:hypothetical protein